MTYNEGAAIVPIAKTQDMLLAIAPDADFDGDYARVQLLTSAAYHTLVFQNHDRSYISYGIYSTDFPLCADFATMCCADVLRGSIKAGLACRPGFLRVIFNRTDGSVHEICGALRPDGTMEYYEPQTDTWSSTPDLFKSFVSFKLI